MRRLLAERDEVARMGARGREAVATRYCWEVVEPSLLHFYRRLCNGSQGAVNEPADPV